MSEELERQIGLPQAARDYILKVVLELHGSQFRPDWQGGFGISIQPWSIKRRFGALQ